MAVYTQLEMNDVLKVVEEYKLGTLKSFDGIADGIENTNYKIKTDRGSYVLTLFEKRVKEEDVPFYLSAMSYLKDRGIPCPAVLRPNRKPMTTLRGKPAIVTSFIEGVHRLPTDVTALDCAAMGGFLARLHKVGRDFLQFKENNMGLNTWDRLITSCAPEKIDALKEGLSRMLIMERRYLTVYWPKTFPQGLVHADLFPDNVFFDAKGAVSGVIDFYFSCTDFLTYDLMLTFNAWCFEDGVLNMEKSKSFLEAYHDEKFLTEKEVKFLPFFGRAAALRIIATRLFDQQNPAETGALVHPKNPLEYVKILEKHQNTPQASHYGFKI